jgi:phosphoglycerol transferase
MQNTTEIWRKSALWVASVLAAVFVLFRTFYSYPSVMWDEFLYSMQSRLQPLSESQYPNHLFNLVFSSTNFCGPEFANCGKSLNLIFFAIFLVFILLIAQRFLSPNQSYIVTIATAVSPLNTFVLHYMPEMMYFAIFAAVVWLTLRLTESGKWIDAVLLGVAFGALWLTKPHALMLVPAFVLYFLLFGGAKLTSRLKPMGIWMATALAVRLIVGFAIAGVNGLNLFGAYGATFGSIVNAVPAKVAETNASLVSTFEKPIQIRAEVAPIEQLDIFTYVSNHIAGHTAAVLAILGVAFFMIASSTRSALLKRNEIRLSTKFAFLIFTLLVSMILLVSAFEFVTQSAGDDNAHRLLMRYYEFIIPFAFIAALGMTSNVAKRSTTAWILALGGIAVWVGLQLVSDMFGFTQSPSSSAIVTGFDNAPAARVIAIVLGIALVITWMINENYAKKALAWAIIPVVMLTTSIAVTSSILTVKNDYQLGGEYVHANLSKEEISKLIVVAPSRQYAYQALFAIDAGELPWQQVDAYSSFDSSAIPADKEYALVMGPVGITGAYQFKVAGTGFNLIRKVNPLSFDFSRETVGPSSVVTKLDNFITQVYFGAWSGGGESYITLANPVSANAKLKFTLIGSPEVLDRQLTFWLGDNPLSFKLHSSLSPIEIELPFTNAEPTNTLRVTCPTADVATFRCLGFVKYEDVTGKN